MKQKGNVKVLKNQSKRKSSTIQKIFNLIILDESGSMSTIEKQAISGLNETFQTIRNAQKEHLEQQHFISFVTFNSARIRSVMNRQKVESDKNLKWTDYKPNECTPLFDAMGQSLNELKNHVSAEDVVLVTIITDGYENASIEYSGHDIKRLVSELKEKGWVFAYIGTNQDVDAVADDMGIRSRMSYKYSEIGARCMFAEERRSKRTFYDMLSRMGRHFLMDEEYDYFNPNQDDDEEQEKESNNSGYMDDDSQTSSSESDGQDEDNQNNKDDNQQQGLTDVDLDSEESEMRKSLWGKIKDFLL